MNKAKKLVVTLCASGLLSVGAAAPASAQPLVTGGLVNITIVDVANNNTILSNNNVNLGAALNLAASVCEVNVNVLARQLRTGGATCTTTTRDVTISQVAG